MSGEIVHACPEGASGVTGCCGRTPFGLGLDSRMTLEPELVTCAARSAATGTNDGPWRIGQHYGIHVYEGDRPVATFHRPEDAVQAVADREAVRRVRELLAEGDEQEWNGTTHNIRLRRALDGAET